MSPKTYYELLDLPPSASNDDVKRSFRQLIARYHPDKVQHLGKEFQQMAAERAAELTEAYRVLSHQSRRAEYDRQISATATTRDPLEVVRPVTSNASTAEAPRASDSAPPVGGGTSADAGVRQFTEERSGRDELLRKATLQRFGAALAHVAGALYQEVQLKGFDGAWAPKARLFGRKGGPRLLARIVPVVDAAAVADSWNRAGAADPSASDDMCVILMGTSLAPPRDLANAIADQRRRPTRGGRISLIPVDVHSWRAHMPTDAPQVAKDILAALQTRGPR